MGIQKNYKCEYCTFIKVALKTTDKTFKEIGAKINETFK